MRRKGERNPADTRIGKTTDTLLLRLKPGQRVCIRSGALAKIPGVVVAHRTGGRVLVLLEQGVHIEIDQSQVMPILAAAISPVAPPRPPGDDPA